MSVVRRRPSPICTESRLCSSGARLIRTQVRIPLADSTVVKAPTDINPQSLVLMADIFPTGFFAARNAFKEMSSSEVSDSVVVVIGCGPVGLCAIINALEYKPKHLLAVDLVESRLQLAQKFGAETWNSGTDMDGLTQRVKDLTEGRGADAVIEVVGASPALRAAFDLLRPWGFISSVGIHNREVFPTLVSHYLWKHES